ncbi:Blue-light-activated protein [Agrobacterium tumefaciens]|uniref:ATP-binding protein n=1 Tax=Agrobacterium tumefaciens TaxID=358 RepID=UPI001ADC4211|nr:ATP-binding protein [Agrobacterium tumefaciens]QTK82924.1 Blue-light-activated protein [Agrobacterium tumefaciens]
MINRLFLQSIAFRLPFAIVFICSSVFILSAVAIYGLQKARTEMATYSLQAFSSLARASLVSRQVADLVSSAPLLMNATSPYRVSSESRAVVAQVDSLLDTIGQDKNAETPNNVPSDDIVQLLQAIRQQTLSLAADADAAQQHKAEAAAALGEIATSQSVTEDALRQRLNAIVQAAANSASLFQLGELQRRFTSETGYFMNEEVAPDDKKAVGLAPYKRVFDAQTQYLLEMFAIQSSVSKLHTVSRNLSHATETQSEAVAHRLTQGLASASAALTRLIVMVAIAFVVVVILSTLSIRSVMRVSKGVTALSRGMNALANGEQNVSLPTYRGSETELIRLSDAFHAFKESVDRVSRLRRTAEAAARTIRSTFRTMNEGIALFDTRGQPITMNRRIIELVGRRGGSSRKLPLRSFIETIPEIDPILVPANDETGTLANRLTVRHRTADQRVTEIAVSRQPDGGIVLLARDVTALDRQEAESAKAQRLDGIMRMTHQLSHEVGNMIGIITGSLGLLERETGFSDRQQRNIKRIRKAADRGRQLASSMLSIGSQQPIHPASVDVGSVLKGMVDVLEIAVGARNQITLRVGSDLPRLALDAALFEQSILNLCLNAAAAMPVGGTIIIEATHSEGSVEISVEDTGCGMDQDAVDRAFEPYFTTRSQQGGTGLGLAIVYGFMRQSGGDAKITSQPGRGTRVSLMFRT